MAPIAKRFVAVMTVCLVATVSAQAETPDAAALAKSQQRGVDFLKTAQAADGSWGPPQSPGVSALVTYALLESKVPASDPAIAKALKHLETFVQPDGAISAPKSPHVNYDTSLAVLAFGAANQDGKYDTIIRNANQHLRKLQWDQSESIDESDVKYGGAGYGREGDRPDLSNTTFFVDALVASGATAADPALQKAIVFLSRCQNLESEFNRTEFAAKINDGGFYYTPAGGGNSPAGKTDNGGLRSYGAMTYAGLKSMLVAGLTPEDKRVQAALSWIKMHYTVKENPGLGQQGYYYYCHLFAKSLSVLELKQVEDAQGNVHDWRQELTEHLISMQQPNGAWINKSDRWFEGTPDLATSFALLALHYCEP